MKFTKSMILYKIYNYNSKHGPWTKYNLDYCALLNVKKKVGFRILEYKSYKL